MSHNASRHSDSARAGDGSRRPARRAHVGAQFVFELGSLRRGGGPPRQFIGDGTLPDLQVSGSFIAPDEPLHVEARIESVHDGVLVSGSVQTRWQGTCGRCLEAAQGPLVVDFVELCVEDGDPETTYPLGAEELELDPIVHDACILNLPLAPLCSPDCLGICAECGTNRNVTSCSCVESPDPRWSGLAVLNGGRVEPSPKATSEPHTS